MRMHCSGAVNSRRHIGSSSKDLCESKQKQKCDIFCAFRMRRLPSTSTTRTHTTPQSTQHRPHHQRDAQLLRSGKFYQNVRNVHKIFTLYANLRMRNASLSFLFIFSSFPRPPHLEPKNNSQSVRVRIRHRNRART